MTDKPAPPSRNFVDAFTGIRGVACFFVILCHEFISFSKGNRSVQQAGYLAVPLFFILSAYLLTKNMLKEIEPKKDQPPRAVWNMTLVNYYIKRLFRIYPAFAGALLFDCFVAWYYYRDFKGQWAFLKIALKGGRVGNHLWTMRTEMIFYFIVLPIFAVAASILMKIDYKHFRNSRLKTFYLLPAALIISISCIVYRYLIIEGGEYLELYRCKTYFYPHFPFFGYGMLAGTLSHYLQPYKLTLDTKLKKFIVEGFSYATLVFMYFANDTIGRKYLGHTQTAWWQQFSFNNIFVAIMFLMLEKAGTQCSIGAFFSSPMIVWMGKCSFSVYLVHGTTQGLMNKEIKNLTEADGTLIQVLAAFFFGFILYAFVEEPCFKLAKPAIKRIQKAVEYVSERINKRANHIQLDEEDGQCKSDKSLTRK